MNNEQVNDGFYVGLDMGGTHTDAVAIRRKGHLGTLTYAVKVPTDHADLMHSALLALRELFREVDPAAVKRVTLGSTLGINAVVRGVCDPVGLALSAGPGLNPVLAGIGSHVTVPAGALDHRGEEITPLDERAFERTCSDWLEQGIAAFACVGKFSPRNPAHEKAMAQIVRRACLSRADHNSHMAHPPQAPIISQGHLLSGLLNFPRRTATAYWNAATWRLHNAFADAAEAALEQCGVTAPLYLLKADGGAVPLSASRHFPIRALLSGPAASVMGVMAVHPTTDDLLILDMGGTTTDIALFASGVPVLEPEGLIVEGRPTLVRSLKSVSLGLGGDSLLHCERDTHGVLLADTGPDREGPAMAFGGLRPTLLDVLNFLGQARTGDTAASTAGVRALADSHGCDAACLAQTALQSAFSRLNRAVQNLLTQVNNRPVYTLAALLENRLVEPCRAVLAGGPALAVAPLVSAALGMPVDTLGFRSDLAHDTPWAVANAIGAALTRPTAGLDLFADTQQGRLLVPTLNIQRKTDRAYTLGKAEAEARSLLHEQARQQGMDGSDDIDITDSRSFAMLDAYGRSGRDIRVSAQLRPGLVCRLQTT